MLQRAVLGTLGRFSGIMLESYAGKLPLWLAPHQIMVCPITTEADSYGVTVLDALKAAGLRAGVDLRNEKINYKVREHSVSKIPVILAVGGREAEGQTVSMRRLGSKESQVLSLGEAVQILSDEATPPDLRA